MKTQFNLALLSTLALFATSSAFAGRHRQLVCDLAEENRRFGITLNGPTTRPEIDPSSVARLIISRVSENGTETVISDAPNAQIQRIALSFPGTEQETLEALTLSLGRSGWLELVANGEPGQMTLRSSSRYLHAPNEPTEPGVTVTCGYVLLRPRPALSGGNQ